MHHTPWRYVRQRVPVEPGARHVISFVVRGEFVETGDGGRGPGVHVNGSGGTYSLSYDRRMAGSFEWRRVILAEDAAFGDATEVEVTLENHRGGGTVWLDDVSMVEQTPRWEVRRIQERSPAFTMYRRSFWDCWKKGITGQGFWNYAAPGFAVVYDGAPDELIPSVRWEGWREGVEDDTYLWMLRESVQAGHGAERVGNEAQELLGGPVREMAQNEDAAALAAVRERVLRLLGAMR